MTRDGKKHCVLLISMSLLPSNHEESYYAYESGNKSFYFRGISQMEAGTKYFLRLLQSWKEKLDKIIIVESYESRNRKYDVTGLIESYGEENDAAREMNSVDFYKERIREYISGKEKKHMPVYKPGDKLTEEDCRRQNENINKLQEQVYSYENGNGEEIPKLYPLDYTEDEIKNLFIDIELKDEEQSGTSEAIYSTVKEICDNVDNFRPVVLYTDMQGARRNETFIINAALKMLDLRKVKVKASVAIDFEQGKNKNGNFNYIIDTTVNDRILDMVSGMKEFQTTGRGDTLVKFWEQKNGLPGVSEEEAKREKAVIDQIKAISDAISLCYVEKFEDGLLNFKNAVDDYEMANQEDEHPLFRTFVKDIKQDYSSAGLLDEQIEVKNAVDWCLNKKLYQQALTVIEADVPREAYKHIYYKDTEGKTLAGLLKFAYTHGFINGTEGYRYIDAIDSGDNQNQKKWLGGERRIPPKYLFDRETYMAIHPEYVWLNYAIFWKNSNLNLFSEVWSHQHSSGQEGEISYNIINFLRQYHEIKILRNGINHANPQEVFDSYKDKYNISDKKFETEALQEIIEKEIKSFFRAYNAIKDIYINLYECFPIEDSILNLINEEQTQITGAEYQ